MSQPTIAEGVYQDLPAAEYHAAEGASKSLLWEFGQASTPLHFKKRKPKVATLDMQFGTVNHVAILQPELLHLAYYTRPEKYPSTPKATKANPAPDKVMKPWNGNSDWCKDWLEEHKDRPVLTSEQVASIPKIVARVEALEEFGQALDHGQSEVSFFKKDEETGLMLKCRPDLVATDRNNVTWLFDPKKVQSGCANKKDFEAQAYNLGYHVQAASYLHITGATHFVFVPFDDDEPFDAIQWRATREFLDAGYREWRRLLLAYAECFKTDKWPGYPSGLNHLELPKFAKRAE
jgi:hypothetical protein